MPEPDLTVWRVVVDEPAGRPVVVAGIAATGAVQAGDVLQRDEDVPVQLDVRHVLDVAVCGEDAVLVFAAEQGELDGLALVLRGVILHRRPP